MMVDRKLNCPPQIAHIKRGFRSCMIIRSFHVSLFTPPPVGYDSHDSLLHGRGCSIFKVQWFYRVLCKALCAPLTAQSCEGTRDIANKRSIVCEPVHSPINKNGDIQACMTIHAQLRYLHASYKVCRHPVAVSKSNTRGIISADTA